VLYSRTYMVLVCRLLSFRTYFLSPLKPLYTRTY